MRFAIAGNNATAIDLLRELTSSAEHTLNACALSGELAAAVNRLAIPVTLAATVEDALLAGDVDIVVVAIDDLDESLRIVRAAVQADRHVVVIPPPSCSPAYSFELHLILDECQRGILPLLPRMAIQEIPHSVADLRLELQATRQLSVDLPLLDSTGTALRSTFIRGLDYLSASGFKFSQVTALDANAPDGSLLSRLITLSAATTADGRLPPAMLTMKPMAEPNDGIVLRIAQSGGTTRIVPIAAVPKLLDRITTICQSRELCEKWMESFSVTLELAEAVDKSLRRRRTVDVHFDSGSEKGVFKSQMTAIGCGVLVYMMLGMVAYLILAQLVPLPDTALHFLRILWIAPLVLFLLAQALLPLARNRGSSSG